MNDEVRLGYTHAFTKKSRVQLSYGWESDYERLDGATYDFPLGKTDSLYGEPCPKDTRRAR